MKKNIKVTLILICMIGFFYLSKTNKTTISNVALANIEALAEGEDTGNYICLGSGNVDCNGYKVHTAIRKLK